MSDWRPPTKGRRGVTERNRRKQRRMKAYGQRQRKRKLRGLETVRRDREEGGYR